MAVSTRTAIPTRDAIASAVTALLDGGSLCLYGAPRPRTADDEPRGPLLAELRFGTPAFEAPRGGQAIATPLIADASAEATGLATWFRARAADGTAVFDGSVGTSDANLVMNNANVQVNAIVSVSAFTYRVPPDSEEA